MHTSGVSGHQDFFHPEHCLKTNILLKTYTGLGTVWMKTNFFNLFSTLFQPFFNFFFSKWKNMFTFEPILGPQQENNL